MRQKIEKDLTNGLLDLILNTQILARINETKIPDIYPIKEASTIFL